MSHSTGDPGGHRLPPGQQWVAGDKWPLVGEREAAGELRPWTVSLAGLVRNPACWNLDELRALPWTEQTQDIHCVTRWSKPSVRFGGVALAELVRRAEPLTEAAFVSFTAHSPRRHGTSLKLADALELSALVAFSCEGKPLAPEHGGPVRMVVPDRYFYKSIKWLVGIELLAQDRLGHWEAVAGYHNHADPWRQQRYMAPALDKQETARLLASRDFSHRELRSIDCQDRELCRLNARESLLRDADFRRAVLREACFDRANLTNAHFAGADLRDASFVSADLEGTDFSAADLRRANLSGASLFGASFCDAGENGPQAEALLDATTRIDPQAIELLTPIQAAFVRRKLEGPAR